MAWLCTRTCENFVNKMHSIFSSISKVQNLYFWEIWKASSSNSASYISDKWVINQFIWLQSSTVLACALVFSLTYIVKVPSRVDFLSCVQHSIFQRKISRGEASKGNEWGSGEWNFWSNTFGQIYLAAFPSSHWKLQTILVCWMICNALQKVNQLCLLS